jgi:hypothetical protein
MDDIYKNWTHRMVGSFCVFEGLVQDPAEEKLLWCNGRTGTATGNIQPMEPEITWSTGHPWQQAVDPRPLRTGERFRLNKQTQDWRYMKEDETETEVTIEIVDKEKR